MWPDVTFLRGAQSSASDCGKKDSCLPLRDREPWNPLFSIHHTIRGFNDSDYAGDLGSRRSITGFIFTLYGVPIAWCSRRQSCVALSSIEAEFVASCEAAKEAILLKRVLVELVHGFYNAVPLMFDNKSAFQLVKNLAFNQRTKHIHVRYCFVRERQEASDIDILYVPSEN